MLPGLLGCELGNDSLLKSTQAPQGFGIHFACCIGNEGIDVNGLRRISWSADDCGTVHERGGQRISEAVKGGFSK